MMQFFTDFLLIFQIQAAAAAVIAMHQMCLCYISLIAAVTAAVPVNGSSSVPFIRRIQGCQPAETSSGDIHSVPARRACQAPAAFYLPCFQVMCCYIFFLSTGTSAPPAGSSAFVFDPVKSPVSRPNTRPVRSSASLPLMPFSFCVCGQLPIRRLRRIRTEARQALYRL